MPREELSEEEVEEEKRKARDLLTPEERVEEQKALQRAKELEKEHLPTAQEEAEDVKELVEESEHAKKLLKPAWYLKKTKKEKEE
jgi:hypothetical protein